MEKREIFGMITGHLLGICGTSSHPTEQTQWVSQKRLLFMTCMYIGDRWNVRPARSEKQVQVQAFLTSITLSWKKAIWNSGGFPRHSFQAWLVTLNRLPTRDIMISWGLSVPPTCLLCNLGDESRDHLFFSCSFSWELWSHHAQRIEITPTPDWHLTLLHMQALPGPTWRWKLQLLV